jgi:hypothetical protein
LSRGRRPGEEEFFSITVRGFAHCVVQNPKSESRNPKQIPNLKSEGTKPFSYDFAGIGEVWNLRILVIGICFGFRDSDFGFETETFPRAKSRTVF